MGFQQDAAGVLNQAEALITPQDIQNFQTTITPPEQLDPHARDFNIYRTAAQLVNGFLSGFTALPIGEYPRNTVEALARAIGSLGGFVGTIFPGETVGTTAARGLLRLSTFMKTAQFAKSVKGIGWLARTADVIADSARLIAKFRSVPMFGADQFMKLMETEPVKRLIWNKLASKPVLEQMLYQGLHLGAASSVASLYQGVGSALMSGIYGTIAGGLFGAIGNLPFAKEQATLNTVLKAIAGSLSQGLPSTIEGQDTATQVYEYLMGAYFGAVSHNADTFRAVRFVSRLNSPQEQMSLLRLSELQERPEKLLPFQEEFYKLDENVRKEVIRILNENNKPDVTEQILYEAFRRFMIAHGVPEDIVDSMIELQHYASNIEVGDYVQIPGDSQYYKVEMIVEGKARLEGLEGEYDVRELTKLALDPLGGYYKSLGDKGADELDTNFTADDLLKAYEDFDAVSYNVAHPFKQFAKKILGDEVQIADTDFQKIIHSLIGKMYDATAQGKGWKEFERYANQISQEARGAEVETDIMNGMKQIYYRLTKSTPIKIYGFDETTHALVELGEIEAKEGDLPALKDADGNRIDNNFPRLPIQEITEDDAVYAKITHVIKKARRGTLKQVESTNRYEFQDAHFKAMNNSAMQEGYYLFSGISDKPQFVIMKLPENVDEEFTRVANAIRSTGYDFDTEYRIGEFEFTRRGFGTPEDYKRLFTANVLYHEKINGLPIEKLAPSGTHPINNIPQPILRLLIADHNAMLAAFTEAIKPPEGITEVIVPGNGTVPVGKVKEEALANGGIYTLRGGAEINKQTIGIEVDFGNPFTHLPLSKTKGAVKRFPSIKAATEAYREWLTTDKYDEEFPELLERKKAILEAIRSGKLKGKKLYYYRKIGAPSHAEVLRELIDAASLGQDVELAKRYIVEEVKKNKDKIYVFGDNLERKGKGGQAIIRDEDNAFGIAVKKKPSTDEDAYFTDEEYEENKKVIDEDIQKIVDEVRKTGKTVVLPRGGIGTGLAKLKEKAPKTFEYLRRRLIEEFSYDIATGTKLKYGKIREENLEVNSGDKGIDFFLGAVIDAMVGLDEIPNTRTINADVRNTEYDIEKLANKVKQAVGRAIKDGKVKLFKNIKVKKEGEPALSEEDRKAYQEEIKKLQEDYKKEIEQKRAETWRSEFVYKVMQPKAAGEEKRDIRLKIVTFFDGHREIYYSENGGKVYRSVGGLPPKSTTQERDALVKKIVKENCGDCKLVASSRGNHNLDFPKQEDAIKKKYEELQEEVKAKYEAKKVPQIIETTEKTFADDVFEKAITQLKEIAEGKEKFKDPDKALTTTFSTQQRRYAAEVVKAARYALNNIQKLHKVYQERLKAQTVKQKLPTIRSLKFPFADVNAKEYAIYVIETMREAILRGDTEGYSEMVEKAEAYYKEHPGEFSAITDVVEAWIRKAFIEGSEVLYWDSEDGKKLLPPIKEAMDKLRFIEKEGKEYTKEIRTQAKNMRLVFDYLIRNVDKIRLYIKNEEVQNRGIETTDYFKVETPDYSKIEEGEAPEEKHQVYKVISGGQTGVDQIGLEVGMELGFQTGGMAPPGYATAKGPNPELKEKYGLDEMQGEMSMKEAYRARTIHNIENSDGTVIFGNTDSPGTKLTLLAAQERNKPVIVNPSARELRSWLIKHKIEVLNVAGNREHKLDKGRLKEIRETLKDALSDKPFEELPLWNINVYAGKGENTMFSNFAIRPFVWRGRRYNSVEQAFQSNKSGKFNKKVYSKYKPFKDRYGYVRVTRHRGPQGETTTAEKEELMYELVYESFRQNPEAREMLLNTENARFTHHGEDSEWREIFPRILMDVRDALRKEGYGKKTQETIPTTERESVYQKLLSGKPVSMEELMSVKGIGRKRAQEILKAMKQKPKKIQKGFILDPISYNKRMQILFNSYYGLDEEIYAEAAKKYNLGDWAEYYVLVNDLSPIQDTDGGATIHDDVLKAELEAAGLPTVGGFSKPFYISQDPQHGVLLGKLAQHSAGKDFSKAMEKAGIGRIIPVSAAKQYGTRQVYDIKYEKGRIRFFQNGIEVPLEKVERYKIKPSEIKTSFGVYDNTASHVDKPFTLYRPIFTILTREQVGEEAIRAMQAYLEENFKGDPKYNQLLKEYLSNPTEEKLKVLEEHFDEIGIKEIFEGMFHENGRAFREMATEHIVASALNFDPDKKIEISEDEYESQIFSGDLDGVPRLIKMLGGSDALMLTKQARKMIEGNFMGYFIKRIVAPKVKYASKAIMRTYDWELRTRIKLKKNEFYLDNAYKRKKIIAYTVDGKKKEMTMEEAWKEYQKIKELKGHKELKRKAKKAFRAVVARVPIDDVSGIASLEFAGWTERPGAGILLHASVKERLGGADNDIDAAAFYFGLPDAFHDALKKNTTPYYERDLYKNYGKLENLFIRAVEGLPLKDKFLGMFDPITRWYIAHAVSKGRGNMMGIATNMRNALHAIYSEANASETKTYESDIYDATGKPTGDKIIFHAREDDGEMLRTLAAVAQQVAVDVAKYGGMVTPMELKAILTAAAFDKITLRKKGVKQEITIYEDKGTEDALRKMVDIKATAPKLITFIDKGDKYEGIHPATYRQRLRMGWKGYTKEGLKQAEKEYEEFRKDPHTITGSLYKTDIGLLNEVRNRLFGKNRRAGIGWTRDQVVDSINMLPPLTTSPYSWIAMQLQGLERSFTPLDMVITANYDLETLYQNMNNALKDLRNNKELENLERKVSVSFWSLKQILAGITPWYNPHMTLMEDKNNLAFERGRLRWSYDEGNFLDYLVASLFDKNYIKEIDPIAVGKAMQVAVRSASTPDDAYKIFVEELKKKDPDIPEPIADHFKPLVGKFLRNPKAYKPWQQAWRFEFITREITKANDFLSNDLRLIASIKTLKQFYERSGIKYIMGINDKTGEKEPLVKFINGSIAKAKQLYKEFWASKNSDEMEPIPYSQVLNEIANIEKQIVKAISDLNKSVVADMGAPPVDINKVLDYFYAGLLSDVSFAPSPLNKEVYTTEVIKLGLDVAPPRVLYKFGENLKQLYEILSQPAEYISTGELRKYLRESFYETPAGVREINYEYINKVVFRNKGIELSPEYKKLAKEIAELASTYAPFADNPMVFWEFIRGRYGVATPQDMTIYQLEGLRNLLKRWKTGPGFWNYFTKGGEKDFKKTNEELEKKGLPFRIRHTMEFARTVADETKAKDLVIRMANVFENGKLSENAPILPHVTKEGKIVYVYADVAKAYTHFDILIDHAEKKEHLSTQAYYTYDLPILEKVLSLYMQDRIKPVNPADEFDSKKFIEMVVSLREMDGMQRAMNRAKEELRKDPHNPHKKAVYEKLLNNYKVFQKRFMKYGHDYMHKIYSSYYHVIDDKGQSVKMMGKDLIEMAKKHIAEVLDEHAVKKIYLTEEWIKKYIKVNKAKLDVQIAPTLEILKSIFKGNLVPENVEDLPYEAAKLIAHENEIEHDARDYADKVPIPKLEEVLDFTWELSPLKKFLTDKQIALVKKYVTPYRTPEERIVFINAFLKGIREPKNIDYAIASTKPGKYNSYTVKQKARIDGYKKAKEFLQELAKKFPGISPEELHAKALDSLEYNGLRKMMGYYSKPLVYEDGSKHVTAMMFDIDNYSQYETDVLLATGKIDRYTWLKRTLRFYVRPFRGVGRIEGIWPHMDYDRNILIDEITKAAEVNKDNPEALRQLNEAVIRLLRLDTLADGGLLEEEADGILKPKRKKIQSLDQLYNMRTDNPSSSLLHRSFNLDGYSRDLSVLEQYLRKLNTAIYSTVGNILMKNTIIHFERNQPLGEYSWEWSNFMRLYVRRVMGYPEIYDDNILKGSSFGKLLKKTPLYWLSDHAAFKYLKPLRKMFLRMSQSYKLTPVEFFMLKEKLGRMPTEAEIQQEEARKLTKMLQDTPENMEAFGFKLKGIAQAEARYEGIALLSHLKTMIVNYGTGHINTIIHNGLKPWIDAGKLGTWQEIGIQVDGRPVRTMEDVERWVSSLGVLENFILQDANVVDLITKRPETRRFFKEAIDAIKENPKVSFRELSRLAEKYHIKDEILRRGFWFMRYSERKLRMRSFLTGYLARRRSFGEIPLEYDNLDLIEHGRKSVEWSQFLYDAPHKPAFAATSLGQIYSRFKLWAWQSVRFRRLIIEEAAAEGYDPNSESFKRLQRAATADLFLIGLAMLLPFTIFDFGLPTPYSWFQSLANWMFGDEKERERAFFIESFGLPKEVAPVSELLPPLARIPKGTWEAFETIWDTLLSDEASNISQYTMWTLFPFGRLTRDAIRAIENPSMAFDFMTGLPLHRIGRLKKKLLKEGQL